jgi:hypothetical protein
MVLMGNRRPEERHDAVTDDLIDRAFIAMYRLHHALQHRVDKCPCVFGIAVGQQLHRSLQVGEEHGHLLTLAFEASKYSRV